MANCPEVGVSYHAVWRAGAVATPVLFLLSEDELRHVLSDSGAVLAITTPEFLAKVRAAAAGLPGLRAHRGGGRGRRQAGDGDGGPPLLPLADLEAAEPGDAGRHRPGRRWPPCCTPAARPAAPRAS